MWNAIHRLFTHRRTQHLEPAAAPLKQFSPPVKRFAWKARWDARREVRAGVSLQEYLEARLGIYNREAPQARLPLPFLVEVAGGQINRIPNSGAAEDPRLRQLSDPAGVQEAGDSTSFAVELEAVRALNRPRAEAVLRDLEEKEQQIGRLNARLAQVRDDLEVQEVAHLQVLGDGGTVAPATLRRAAEKRGKPLAGSVWPIALGYAAMGVFILGEAWQYFSPFADLTGVDIRDPWQTPLGAIGAGFFAAGAAFVSVILSKVPLAKMRALTKEGVPLRQQLFGWLGVLAGWGVYAGFCLALGMLRHTGGESASDLQATLQGASTASAGMGFMPPWVLPVINFVVPIGLAAFWVWGIRKLQNRRRQQREARWRWDGEESLRIEVGERREAVIERLQEAEQTLEQARENAHEQLQQIAEEAQEAEAQIRRTLDRERQYGLAWVNAVVAALHQDRLAFVQQARLRGRQDLLVSGPEPHEPAAPIQAPGKNGHLRQLPAFTSA